MSPKVPVPGSTLKVDPEKLAAFRERGRRSSAKALGSNRRPISPTSKAQKQRVAEVGFCVVCGEPESPYRKLTFAHLWKRQHGGCDSALCGAPMCVTPGGLGCHNAYERGELDLLPVVEERWEFFRPLVQHALEHAHLVELVQELANDRVAWQSSLDGEEVA